MGALNFILGFVGAVIVGVAVNDLSACADYLHRGILWLASRFVPVGQREEMYKAWVGDLAARPPSAIWRTIYALDCVRGGLVIGVEFLAKEKAGQFAKPVAAKSLGATAHFLTLLGDIFTESAVKITDKHFRKRLKVQGIDTDKIHIEYEVDGNKIRVTKINDKFDWLVTSNYDRLISSTFCDEGPFKSEEDDD
jgi:hypothetical protein